MLGPVLIAALLAVFWLDGVLDAVAIPAALRGWVADRETLPRGLALFLAACAISPLATLELAAILRANGVRASNGLTWGAATVGLVVSCTVPKWAGGVESVALVSTAATVVLLGALAYYSRGHTVEGVVAAAAGAMLAFVYLGLMFGFVLAMRRSHSEWVVFGVLAVTKSCDIGAYFTGRALGRRKLIPWLSPGKTWEGLFGGVAVSTALGALGAWLLRESDSSTRLAPWQGALIGGSLAVAGQAGDLIASLLKRDAGMKDSSNRLPGYGGVLDVVDSPLLAAPVGYWLLLAFAGAAPAL